MTNNKLEIGSMISTLQINNDKVSTKFLYVKCLIKKKKNSCNQAVEFKSYWTEFVSLTNFSLNISL